MQAVIESIFFLVPVLGVMNIKIGLLDLQHGDIMSGWTGFFSGIITIVLGGFIAHYLQHITKENDRIDNAIEKFNVSIGHLVEEKLCKEKHKNIDEKLNAIENKIDILLELKK